MSNKLKELMKRAETWPEEAQEELVQVGLEIEAGKAGVYYASADELRAIDDADRDEVASEDEVRATFEKFRRG